MAEPAEELAEKAVELGLKETITSICNEEDSIGTAGNNKIITKVLWRRGVRLTPAAKRELKQPEELGFSNYPIRC